MLGRWAKKKTFKSFVEPPNGEYGSKALCELVECHIVGKGVRILDFGGALSENISFYSKFSKKIHIGDLYPKLQELTSNLNQQRDYVTDEELHQAFEDFFESEFMALPKSAQFDVIFFWDVLNHLDLRGLKAFNRALIPHIHANTVGLAFLATNPQIPDVPIKFEIIDKEKIRYSCDPQKTKKVRCHTKPELKQFFNSFERSRSYLKRNGQEELLLRRSRILALPHQQAEAV